MSGMTEANATTDVVIAGIFAGRRAVRPPALCSKRKEGRGSTKPSGPTRV